MTTLSRNSGVSVETSQSRGFALPTSGMASSESNYARIATSLPQLFVSINLRIKIYMLGISVGVSATDVVRLDLGFEAWKKGYTAIRRRGDRHRFIFGWQRSRDRR